MYCGKCGSKLQDNAKFCGKCGWKVPEVILNRDVNTNTNEKKGILNIFSVFTKKNDKKKKVGKPKKSKNNKNKNNNTGTQKDDINEIMTLIKKDNRSIHRKKGQKDKESIEPEKKSNKGKKGKGIKNKTIKKKPTKKPAKKSKPKKQSRLNKSDNEGKKINKKLLFIIACSVVLVLAAGSIFLIIKNKSKSVNSLFKGNNVLVAINNTYKKIENNYAPLDDAADIYIQTDKNDDINSELYLKINNIRGGFSTEDVLGSLNGFSIKLNQDTNNKENEKNTKLEISNSKNKSIYAQINSSGDKVALYSPTFYDKVLGINGSGQQVSTISSTNSKLANVEKIITNIIPSLGGSKKVITSSLKDFTVSVANSMEFEKDKGSKDTKTDCYTATVKNEKLFNEIEKTLTNAKANEDLADAVSYALYVAKVSDTVTDGKTKYSTYMDKAINKIKDMSDEDKNVDATIEVYVSDKQVTKASFNTKLFGDNISITIDIPSDNDTIGLKSEIKMVNADNNMSLNLDVQFNDDGKNKISKKYSLDFNVETGDILSLELNKSLNEKSKEYNSNTNITFDMPHNKSQYGYKLNGKFKGDKDSYNELNISDINLAINTGFYNVNANFEGHIKTKDNDKLKNLDFDKMVQLNAIDQTTYDNIMSDIKKNALNFLDKFGNFEF